MLGATIAFRDTEVVLETLVRGRQAVVELVALEHIVVVPGLVSRPVLRVDGAADGPQRSRLPLDPDQDRLLDARIVHAVNDAFGEAGVRRFPPHGARIQSL